MPRFVVFLIFTLTFIIIQGKTYDAVEYSKCCPMGEALSENGNCINSTLLFTVMFSIQENDSYPTPIGIRIGLNCENGRYRLEPFVDSQDEFKILSNGSLYITHQAKILDPTEYCLESFEIPSGEVMALPMICFPPNPADNPLKGTVRTLYTAGCFISIPFLLATLIVYSCTSFLRTDINSKVLSCHVASLTMAYMSLIIVLISGSDLPPMICITSAFSIQFSFLASFFWLNVLCFSMWRRLRQNADPTKIRRSELRKSKESKRFLYYSLYAWGIPTLFVVITIGMDMTPSIPSSYLKPNVGAETCWIKGDTPTLSYFYAPIALIIVANLIIFILSALTVIKRTKVIQNKPATMRQVVINVIYHQRKKVFIECLILFLIMGFNWSFEVISWAVGGPPQMWIVTDLYNTLQGLIVFYVFVYREVRPWKAFKAYLKCTTPHDLDFKLYGITHNGNYVSPPIR